MQQCYSQLASVLSQETALYGALLEILGEEARLLVANDTDGIAAVSRRKDTLALQIRSLEESRLLLVDKLARFIQRPFEGLTLAEIVETAPEAQRGLLAETRERLKSVVERVEAHNDRNRLLVENSLSLLHGGIQSLQSQLRSRFSPPAAYGPARHRSVAPAGGAVLARQV